MEAWERYWELEFLCFGFAPIFAPHVRMECPLTSSQYHEHDSWAAMDESPTVDVHDVEGARGWDHGFAVKFDHGTRGQD